MTIIEINEFNTVIYYDGFLQSACNHPLNTYELKEYSVLYDVVYDQLSSLIVNKNITEVKIKMEPTALSKHCYGVVIAAVMKHCLNVEGLYNAERFW